MIVLVTAIFFVHTVDDPHARQTIRGVAGRQPRQRCEQGIDLILGERTPRNRARNAVVVIRILDTESRNASLANQRVARKRP
jgi:cyanophycinase-like exopeptidase